MPSLPGFTVEIVPELDSTNSELMRRARNGLFEPILLVAERQTAGRGRLGRDWASDTQPAAAGAASLTFSLGLLLAPQDWSGLSLVVGLAVVEALHPGLQLKWPNDVWLDERKLGGILIETATGVGDMRYVVIGVGLNLTMPDSQGLRTPAAALREVLPGVEAPTVLERVVRPLVHAVQRFSETGFVPFRAAFAKRDVLQGRDVLCSDGQSGACRGVDGRGALLVHTAEGLVSITSAEVSVRPAPAPPSPSAFGA
ncbi:biotin--[acetyl-CoA-carboxylase] ligase [Rhodoferax aquaticus]|uniref:biotin--[acetyl-CoA-carboxylase] ligase n=1 Tax=Rhodoferax aquaticus TaxID=2527691 RepID=UPI001EFFC7CB|nr:biotin--[acetyl-CoA-carboxylase] ligase [Rhodoferax aquaticus]